MASARQWWRSKWWLPLVSLFLGCSILAANWIGGTVRQGVYGLAIMSVIGLVFLFGTRSETLRGLGGPGRDERWAHIDVAATAFAGMVLIALVIGLWLNEIAHGRSGNPYDRLGAAAGLAYVAGVIWLRFRA